MLGQQALHQWLVAAVSVQPLAQQLPKGAQGGEGIAKLVHQQLQLVIALAEFATEPLPFQIEPQGFR